jgi:predicted PurR-regulated permease PerM
LHVSNYSRLTVIIKWQLRISPNTDKIKKAKVHDTGFWERIYLMNELADQKSPRWGSTTKLIVGFSLVAVLAFLILRFQQFIGPLLLAFIIAYLFYPLAKALHRWLKFPWRLAVFIVFLFFVLILLGILTAGGFALVGQVQSLIAFIQNALKELPDFLEQLSQQTYTLGPFQFDLKTLDFSKLTQDVLGMAQSVLGQASGLVGRIAGGAASTIGWVAFILLVSFFILSETGGISGRIIRIEVPGYDVDLRRLGSELSQIWNAFLRGQLIIFGIYIVIYTLLLSIFGVHYAIWLALLAGLARFVPYVGPAIVWTTFGLVAGFQGYTIFNLAPWAYVILVVGTSILIDTIMDNFFSTRIMASALKLHPAAVLVAALAGANFLGIIGVFLAAPVLATLKLGSDYIFSKMTDRDPWVQIESSHTRPVPVGPSWIKKCWMRMNSWLASRRSKMDQPPKINTK